MSKKKSTNLDHDKKLRQLRKLHVLKSVPISRKKIPDYTPAEKRKITTAYKSLEIVIAETKKPRKTFTGAEHTFSSRKIRNKKDEKLFKSAGAHVVDGRVFIEHLTREKISITHEKVKGKKQLFISKKLIPRNTDKGYTIKSKQLVADAHDVFSQLHNYYGTDKHVTLRAGIDQKSWQFADIRIKSAEDVEKYLTEVVIPKVTKKFGDTKKDKFVATLTVVELTKIKPVKK